MNNAIQNQNQQQEQQHGQERTNAMEKKASFDVNGETVELTGNMVKRFLVRGNTEVTDQEVVMFINLCKYQKLNPFINEAYLVKFGSQPAQIIVSKEAFMKRAELNEFFEGVEAGIIVERNGEMIDIEGAIKLPNDKLIGAFARVYRNDRKTPITVRISYDEFSKSQATWKQMPMNMIRKTAIVNALREAFPNSVGAMYTEEEMQSEQSDSRKSVEQVVEDNQAKKKIEEFQQLNDKSYKLNEWPQSKEDAKPETVQNSGADEIVVEPEQSSQEQSFNFDDDSQAPF